MGTGSISSKNPTLRKNFCKDELSLSLTSGFDGTLSEGQEVYISANNTVTKRTLGSQFPIGYVKVGGELSDLISVIVNASSDLQAKAIGGTLSAGSFVKPNGNKDADGIPEYVAAVEGDYAMGIVLSGGSANAAIVVLLLEAPVIVPGS